MPAEPDEALLDDVEALAVADPGEMLRDVATAGAQVRGGMVAAHDAGVGAVAGDWRPRSVVVVGMGGSASAGAMLAAVTGPGCPVPVLTHQGYALPGWVGSMDLVLAVSSSGETEETLLCAEEAGRRGSALVAVGPAGSSLAGLAERRQRRSSLLVPVPTHGRQPRANLWSLTVPLLVAADALGLADVDDSVLESTADLLDSIAGRCGPAVETYQNPAKMLAVTLAGAVPVVWGSGTLAGTAAHRFATQLAENAKYPAVYGSLPESGHHQVVMLDGPFAAGADTDDDFFRDRLDEPFGSTRLHLVLLRDDAEEHPQLARRREATHALATERGVGIDEVVAEGSHRLERLAALVSVTDYASVYLALVMGIDPTPVEPITSVKERISE